MSASGNAHIFQNDTMENDGVLWLSDNAVLTNSGMHGDYRYLDNVLVYRCPRLV